MIICPMLYAVNQNLLSDCREDECAWWVKSKRKCAIYLLATKKETKINQSGRA